MTFRFALTSDGYCFHKCLVHPYHASHSFTEKKNLSFTSADLYTSLLSAHRIQLIHMDMDQLVLLNDLNDLND